MRGAIGARGPPSPALPSDHDLEQIEYEPVRSGSVGKCLLHGPHPSRETYIVGAGPTSGNCSSNLGLPAEGAGPLLINKRCARQVGIETQQGRCALDD